MFSGLRFLLWTAASVAFGIFLATEKFGGKTPYEHGKRAWSRYVDSSKLQEVKEKIGATVVDAHDQLVADENQPRERHGPKDRAAVERLIASGTSKR